MPSLLPLLPLLGLLAAAVGISCSWPQVLRLLRSSQADGVSLPSSVLGALSCATWLAYGTMLRDRAQLLANVPGLAGALAILVLVMLRTRSRSLPVLAAVAGWLAVAVGAAHLGGAPAVGTAATAVSLVTRGPQVRDVLRGVSMGALSPASLALSTTASSLWSAYGLLSGLAPVWACSLVSGALTTLVLSRRCPPRVVVRALHRGRWGTPGQVLVRPIVARRAA